MALLISSLAYIFLFFIHKSCYLNKKTQFEKENEDPLYTSMMIDALSGVIGGCYYYFQSRCMKTLVLFSSPVLAVGLGFVLEYGESDESWYSAFTTAFLVGYVVSHDIQMFFTSDPNAVVKWLCVTGLVFVSILFLTNFVFPQDGESLKILLLIAFSIVFFANCWLPFYDLMLLLIQNYTIVALFRLIFVYLLGLAVMAPDGYCFASGSLLLFYILVVEYSTTTNVIFSVLRYDHYSFILNVLRAAMCCILANDARKCTDEMNQKGCIDVIRVLFLLAKFDHSLEINLLSPRISAKTLEKM